MFQLISMVATLALGYAAGSPTNLPSQNECRGWTNYQRDMDFKPGLVEFNGSARQNISLIAISLKGSDAPILVQSGGGPLQDVALSEERSAMVVEALASEGIEADRVRVARAEMRQIAPEGLLIYSRIVCG